jgi:hypothetical protein
MRVILIAMLLLLALTSVVTGLFMISNPEGGRFGLQLSLLNGTPFSSFLIPGILMIVVNFGLSTLALYKILTNNYNALLYCYASGIVLGIWIIMQLMLIPQSLMLCIYYLMLSSLIILTTTQLRGEGAI